MTNIAMGHGPFSSMVYLLKMGGSFHGELLVITRWYHFGGIQKKMYPLIFHSSTIKITMASLTRSILDGYFNALVFWY